MPQTYEIYTEISANALQFNPRGQEVVAKKQEILSSVISHYKSTPKNILFYGFSPLLLATDCKQIAVTGISDQVKKLLNDANVKYTYIEKEDLGQHHKEFSWIVASDEYFTFAESEEEQKNSVTVLSNLAKNLVLTTLRDYKNQDFREREFSQPLSVRNGKDNLIYLEHNDYDYVDKNSYKTTVYEILNSNVKVYGPISRRSMFFKQLAKFSIDAGAKEFFIHKNLMYKSLIKKNYEHVITISF